MKVTNEEATQVALEVDGRIYFIPPGEARDVDGDDATIAAAIAATNRRLRKEKP